MPLIDLRDLPALEREAVALRLAGADARRPFDLSRGPLLRTTLLRLDVAEHVVLLCTHHIVFDAWSAGVFVRELGDLYAAFARGQPSPLPPLPVQYADYAVWQRAWLQGTGDRRQGDRETGRRLETPLPTPNTQYPTPIEVQLTYWKRRLAGRPVPDLPTVRPRPSDLTYGAGRRA